MIARNWSIFVAERFPLAVHGPMVALFTMGNFVTAAHLAGVAFEPVRFSASVILIFSFFFRLRCFDEIKDYEVDLLINPNRPLARGLLQIYQVQKMLLCLTIFELVLSACLGLYAWCAHAVAFSYSMLMYREFFIGRWLRPHLTTYGITHTLVAAVLGLSTFAAGAGARIVELPSRYLLFPAINWFMFNLFEFARKTFAISEERSNVESYSSLFGIRGAVSLSVSQIILVAGLYWMLLQPAIVEGHLAVSRALTEAVGIGITILPLLVAAFAMVTQGLPAVRLFRAVVSAYLLAFYTYVSWLGLV